MYSLKNGYLTFLLLASCATSWTGCSNEARQAKYVKRADEYLAAGQSPHAEIEYLNALRLGSTNAHAIRQLGLLYYDNGRSLRALPFLAKTAELNPQDTEVLLDLATIHLNTGDFRQVQALANAVIAMKPQDEQAPVLLASTARTADNIKTVRQQLTDLQKQIGNTASVNVALGTLLAHEGKIPEAETAFRQALVLDSKSSAAHHAIGMLAWAQNKTNEVASELRTAAELAPRRLPLRMQYADFLIQSGQTEAGKQVFTEMTKKTPDFVPAWVSLGAVALAERQLEVAAGFVKEALNRDPDFYDALILDSRLKLATNDTDNAITQLEKISSLYKSSAAHYFLGIAYLKKGDPTRALTAFSEAVSLNPEFDDAILQQAQLNIRRDNIPAAISSLTQLAKRRPGLSQAYLVLANAYLVSGKSEPALLTYRKAQELFPDHPQIPLMIGTLLQLQGKTSEARAAFEQSLKLQPNSIQPLEMLVNLDLAEKRYAEALERIQTQLTKHPESPELQGLLGMAFIAQGESAKGEAALLKAIQLKPDFLPAYRYLAKLYIETQRQQPALDKLTTLLARNPNDAYALLQMGLLQSELKNYAAAQDAYERFIVINPRASMILNNLAYLYSEHLGRLDKAYDAARKARELSPDNPALADTLGWILYRRGEYTRALPLLQESASKSPIDSEVLFHLGMTQYALGREEPARNALLKATQSGKDFNGKDEATRRLAILSIAPLNVDAQTLVTLQTLIAEHPEDLIVLYRLAAVYERNNDFDKAAQLYERALERNPKDLPATIKLAQIYSDHRTNTTKALQFAKAARTLAPDDPEVAYQLGCLAYETGDYAWSLSLLQEAHSKLPTQADILFDLAISLCSVGRIEEAASQAQAALVLKPAPARIAAVKEFLNLTSLFLDTAKAQSSGAAIQTILKETPNNPLALAVNGSNQERRGEIASARQTYELILQKYPLFSPAIKRLAILYAQPPSDSQKAYSYAVKARAAYPEDAEVAKTLGILTYGRADYNRAALLLKESSTRNPQDGEVLYYLGMSLQQLKQKTDAQVFLRKALTLNLDSKLAEEARRVLAQLN